MKLPLARFRVADDSMWPTLWAGDRLLVWRWARPGPGAIVVLRDPRDPRRYLVKRVAEVAEVADGASTVRPRRWPGPHARPRTGRAVVLLGDNRAVSRDSRDFGPVAAALIVGRVIWRYFPGTRRGRVR